jgi:formiminoglutamase
MTRTADPNWPTAASWIGGDHRTGPVGTLGLLGVPLGKGSITPGRCDLAPNAIRTALAKFSSYDICTDRDLRDFAVADFGDLDLADELPIDAAPRIVDACERIVEKVDLLVILGGNNSVTRPACHALGHSLPHCALLTLDAHLDLRDLDRGPMNGNPVRGLLQDGLPGSHIVQIGIQPFANSAAYAKIAQDSGIEVIDIHQVRAHGIAKVTAEALSRLEKVAARIYVDIDLDVLDRSSSPGTSGSRPGGLSTSELLAAARVCGANPKVAAVDLVEVDPSKDISDITVFAAASCLLNVASGLSARFNNTQHSP